MLCYVYWKMMNNEIVFNTMKSAHIQHDQLPVTSDQGCVNLLLLEQEISLLDLEGGDLII